jgi:hypothetical protein
VARLTAERDAAKSRAAGHEKEAESQRAQVVELQKKVCDLSREPKKDPQPGQNSKEAEKSAVQVGHLWGANNSRRCSRIR